VFKAHRCQQRKRFISMLHRERGNVVEKPKIGSKFDFRSKDSIATTGGVVVCKAKVIKARLFTCSSSVGKGSTSAA
jgi:hypothetical protein